VKPWQKWTVGALLGAAVLVDFKFMFMSVAIDAMLIGLAVWFYRHFEKGSKQ
jgi:predicted branched-subunit amino acid permease